MEFLQTNRGQGILFWWLDTRDIICFLYIIIPKVNNYEQNWPILMLLLTAAPFEHLQFLIRDNDRTVQGFVTQLQRIYIFFKNFFYVDFLNWTIKLSGAKTCWASRNNVKIIKDFSRKNIMKYIRVRLYLDLLLSISSSEVTVTVSILTL